MTIEIPEPYSTAQLLALIIQAAEKVEERADGPVEEQIAGEIRLKAKQLL